MSAAAQKPLINFREPQEEAFLCNLGVLGMVWRRQFGKSYTLAGICLDWMMETPGVLVTIISAAIRLGEENIRKEADIWRQTMTKLREGGREGGAELTTSSANDETMASCSTWTRSRTCSRIRSCARSSGSTT
jgi:hypothetical protein